MKLTDKVKEVESRKKVSDEEIRKFFESLDYTKAEVTTDRLNVSVKFYDCVKVKDYPFPTEQEREYIFKKLGISNFDARYTRSDPTYFKVFEFSVERNKMDTVWYK